MLCGLCSEKEKKIDLKSIKDKKTDCVHRAKVQTQKNANILHILFEAYYQFVLIFYISFCIKFS